MTEEERNARAFVALRLEAFGPDGPMLSVIVDGRPVSWKRAKTRGTRRYTDPAMDAHANRIAAAPKARSHQPFSPRHSARATNSADNTANSAKTGQINKGSKMMSVTVLLPQPFK